MVCLNGSVSVCVVLIVANFRPDELAVFRFACLMWIGCARIKMEILVYYVTDLGILIVKFRMPQVFISVVAFDDVKGFSR